jgi:transposase
MGTIFYLERNGQKYAYEATSRRIPGRKNPKTENIYLGKVDPETGKIIPKKSIKRPSEEHAKHYGSVLLLDFIQKEMGILEDLFEMFTGLEGNIMGAAMSQLIDQTSFDNIHYVVDGSIVKERLKLRGSLSPAVLSDMTAEIGRSFGAMDGFFESRIKRSSDPFITLDVTSVSSYSKMDGWTEWGYNRDGESLKQTNIAMVTDSKGIPLAFTMLPGSISDKAVLNDTVDRLRDMGCCGRLVMDRGFETAANINSLLKKEIEFTVPSNVRADAVKKLMSMAVTDMKGPSSYRRHGKRSYKVAEYELGITENKDGECEYIIRLPNEHKDFEENNCLFEVSGKLKAFIVFDAKKASDDIDRIVDAVSDTELRLEGTRPKDPSKTYDKLPAFIRRYLDYSVDDDGIMHIHRKQNAFTFADNRAGMFVMLASEGTSWDMMMSSYDVRDWVEKAFDVYKNDLDGGRSRTGDPDRARGRLFVKFIALMMRMRIQNVLREHDDAVLSGTVKKDSVNGKTVEDVFRTLNTLMAIGNTGDWRLTAVSKNVREIFKVFGIEEPKSGPVVLS